MLCEHAPELSLRLYAASSWTERCWGEIEGLESVRADLVYCFGLPSTRPPADLEVVFLCHDAGEMRHWLEQPFTRAILQNERLVFALFDATDPDDPLFLRLFATYAGRIVEVVATDWARERYPIIFDALQQRLIGESALASRSLTEFLQFGDAFYQNFYQNIWHLDGAILGKALFGAFKGLPAVICGAGPSLDSQQEVLRILSERAVLFSGGSALNALSGEGVTPHFSVGLDPYYPQYQRLMTSTTFTVPMFFQLRWFAPALALWDGPHIYLNESPVYPLAGELERRLGIAYPALETGHNVVNFSLDLARALGCDPIVLVGVDLCYEGERHYAHGVLTDDVDRRPRRGHPYDLPVMRKNREGQNVYTHWKWLAERDYIAEYAVHHGELTFINATSRGLAIPGLPHISLEELVEGHLREQHPVRSMVHAALATAPRIKAPFALIRRFCRHVEKSLLVCREKLVALEEEVSDGLRALFEVELEQEFAYKLILAPLEKAQRLAGGEIPPFLLEAIEHQLALLPGRT